MKLLGVLVAIATIFVFGTGVYLIFLEKRTSPPLSSSEKQYTEIMGKLKEKNALMEGPFLYQIGDKSHQNPGAIRGFVKKIDNDIFTIASRPLYIGDSPAVMVKNVPNTTILMIYEDAGGNEIKSEVVSSIEVKVGQLMRFYGLKKINDGLFEAKSSRIIKSI